eukprot:11018426-Lingulodinium_polyedra.AAC.1
MPKKHKKSKARSMPSSAPVAQPGMPVPTVPGMPVQALTMPGNMLVQTMPAQAGMVVQTVPAQAGMPGQVQYFVGGQQPVE